MLGTIALVYVIGMVLAALFIGVVGGVESAKDGDIEGTFDNLDEQSARFIRLILLWPIIVFVCFAYIAYGTYLACKGSPPSTDRVGKPSA